MINSCEHEKKTVEQIKDILHSLRIYYIIPEDAKNVIFEIKETEYLRYCNLKYKTGIVEVEAKFNVDKY